VLSPIAAVIGVIISTAIMHGSAKLFGGTGKWGDLAFCFCAIVAPNTLIASVFGLLFLPVYRLGGLLFIPGLISFAIGIYVLALQVNAISAVENISSGKAFLAIILPGIILVLLGVCCTLTVLIPAISSIGQ
jgi:Yip1 domain